MRNTLVALSKNILIKVLIIIIIGVFALWGIGDTFSGGKTNVVAEVSGKNIYSQDFVNELRREMQIRNISSSKDILKENLHFTILNTLISNKIFEIYAEDEKIIINDQTLANFLKQIPEFQDKNAFSRTKYEKFLLENNISNSDFENNFKKTLLKQLIVDSQILGVVATKHHTKSVKEFFSKEVHMTYINLDNIYGTYKPTNYDIDNYYNKNPIYSDEYRNIKYAVIDFKKSNDQSDDQFFKKISEIENLVLSNKKFDEITNQFSLKVETSEYFNTSGEEKNNKKKISLDKKIVEKTFSLNNQINSEFMEINGKFFLLTIDKIEYSKPLPLNDETKKIISIKISNIKLTEKIEEIKKENSAEVFNKILDTNKNQNKDLFLKSRFEKNSIFSTNSIQQIFEKKENDIILIFDKQNYLVKIKKITYDNKETSSNMNSLFERQAIKNFQDQILVAFDKYLNSKYKISINQKVLDRIINSF